MVSERERGFQSPPKEHRMSDSSDDADVRSAMITYHKVSRILVCSLYYVKKKFKTLFSSYFLISVTAQTFVAYIFIIN